MSLPLPWCPRPATVAAANPPILQQAQQLMQQQLMQQQQNSDHAHALQVPAGEMPPLVSPQLPAGGAASPTGVGEATLTAAEAPPATAGASPAPVSPPAATTAAEEAAAGAGAAAAATFEGCLSDARIFFCGEHTSDFGQQCVHGAMHSGVRAAAECLASLFGIDVLPWTRNSWGEQQDPAAGAATAAASDAIGAAPAGKAGQSEAASPGERDRQIEHPSSATAAPAAVTAGAVAEDGKTDAWHSWWYSSDPSYCWGPSAKESHSAPFDTALECPLSRQQRKQLLLQLLGKAQQQH